MLRLPPWIFVLVGLMVCVFGVYRLRLSFRSKEDEARAKDRGGLYGLPNRTHLLVGVIYLLMGIVLLLEAFGINVLRFGQ